MKLSAFIFLLMATGAAADTKGVADNKLPFSYEIAEVSEAEMSGAVATVVTINLKNGDYFLPSANFHCEAENPAGRTWDVTGTATNVDAGEERRVRLVSTTPDTTGDFQGASTVKCAVQAFDGGFR